jgi:hypothetical protein
LLLLSAHCCSAEATNECWQILLQELNMTAGGWGYRIFVVLTFASDREHSLIETQI